MTFARCRRASPCIEGAAFFAHFYHADTQQQQGLLFKRRIHCSLLAQDDFSVLQICNRIFPLAVRSPSDSCMVSEYANR